jgi:hypothetical protein
VIGLPGEENRGLPEDFKLLAQVPNLTAQPAQLLALGRGEAVGAPASRSARLTHSRTAVSVRSSSRAT